MMPKGSTDDRVARRRSLMCAAAAGAFLARGFSVIRKTQAGGGLFSRCLTCFRALISLDVRGRVWRLGLMKDAVCFGGMGCWSNRYAVPADIFTNEKFNQQPTDIFVVRLNNRISSDIKSSLFSSKTEIWIRMNF